MVKVGDTIVFTKEDGRKRKVVISKIEGDRVTGYYIIPKVPKGLFYDLLSNIENGSKYRVL